ncbi:MAG: hypothetical protein ACYC4Q_01460 [Victivallaceae bacterium]
MHGWSEAEALKMNIRDLPPAGLREEALSKVRQLSRSEVMEPYLSKRLSKSGNVLDISITATALMNEAGRMYAIATTERMRT